MNCYYVYTHMFICVGKLSEEEFMTGELLIHYSRLRSRTEVVILLSHRCACEC